MTITIWRFCHEKHSEAAFQGEGFWSSGGRWHSRGTALVYASATLSLAILETFNNNVPRENLSKNFVFLKAQIPDRVLIQRLGKERLPGNWRDLPAPKSLALMGDKWFSTHSSAVLQVPSAIIPHENNYLLNPKHSDFAEIKIYPPEAFI
ncbi:MAG: RES family NAD+ phosphorylase [Cyanobacteriota bacterium]|nr:RES family NAD+ phosphorylase [Cyanobacteriota bacterium]